MPNYTVGFDEYANSFVGGRSITKRQIGEWKIILSPEMTW